MFYRYWTLLLITLLFALPARSQQGHWPGVPEIEVFEQSEYDGHIQNWSTTQDHRGVIFVGNQRGLLTYNGVRWSEISSVPDFSNIRGVTAIHDSMHVYVGGHDMMGYVAPDTIGKYRFHSLFEHLPDSVKNYQDLVETLTFNNNPVFLTDSHLIIWESHSNPAIYSLPGRFKTTFQHNGTLYVVPELKNKHGIYKLSQGALQPAELGSNLPDEIPLFGLALSGQKLLLFYPQSGFIVFNQDESIAWQTPELNNRISKASPYYATVLSDKTIAVATLKNGIFFISENGKLKQHLTTEDGLPHNAVKHLFEDRDGNLWVAFEQYLARIEWQSPVRFLYERDGYDSMSWMLTYFNDNLLAGFNNGLYTIDYSDSKAIQRVYPTDGFINDSEQVNGRLFVASDFQLFEYINSNKQNVVYHDSEYRFVNSFTFGDQPRYHLVSGFQEVIIHKLNADGSFSLISRTDSPDATFYDAQVMNDGWVWGAGYKTNLLGMDLRDNLKGPGKIQSYKKSYGGKQLNIYNFRELFGRLYGITNFGIFEINTNWRPGDDGHPVGDLLFPTIFESKEMDDRQGDILQLSNSKILLVTQGVYYILTLDEDDKSSDRLSYSSIQKLPFTPKDIINQIAVDTTHHNLAISYAKRLATFNLNRGLDTPDQPPHAPVITRIRTINSDSLLFAGVNHDLLNDINLSAGQNAVRFHFASPQYHRSDSVKYRFYLEGYEDSLSTWTTETRKDYTNLSGGSYTFNVQSKNVYHEVSKISSFSFTVHPPWYLTNWAYAGYGLFSLLLIAGIVKYQTVRVERREAEKARMKDIEHRAEAAELQARVAEAQAKVVEAENRRRREELETAQEVQSSFLPDSLMDVPGYNISYYHLPAREVGGDYYDIKEQEGKYYLFLGDATGHGLSAGIMVAMIRSALAMVNFENPGNMLSTLNNAIESISLRLLHMALLIARIDLDHNITISSAAIPHIMHYRKKSECIQYLEANGLPLGAMKSAKFNDIHTTIEPGDTLLLSTDGLPELVNAEDEQLGYERLEDFFHTQCKYNPYVKNIRDECVGLINEWSEGAEKEDDITFIIIQRVE